MTIGLIDPVIVAVHLNANVPMGMLDTNVASRPASTGQITLTVLFTFRCTATITGTITITSTLNEDAHGGHQSPATCT